MRRSVPLLALFALLSGATPALASREWGPIAGLNFATLSIEGTSGTDPRTTFAGGAVVDWGLNDKLGIRVEPTFTSEGGKSTHRNIYWGSNDGAEFDLNCIDVPILTRLDLGKSPAHAFVLGGVGVAFFTGHDVHITTGNYEQTVDFKDILKSTNLSLDLGVGISVPVGTNRMTFDARTAIGMLDINQGGTVTYNGNPLVIPSNAVHTLDFRLMATYLFPWPGH
jgi:hypothetical protein